MKNCDPFVFGPALAIDSMPGVIVLQLRMELILEAVPWSAGAGSGRIAALGHEVLDHTVKDGSVVEALAGEEDKVVDGSGCPVRKQLKHDCAQCPSRCERGTSRLGSMFISGAVFHCLDIELASGLASG